MIYADFESTLMPVGNGKQNPNESYTDRYPKHVACSYGFVSLYKELLEPTFSACPIALDNLCEVFGCSVITDFVSTMLGLSKVFG